MKGNRDKITRFKISNFTYNLVSFQVYESIKINPANLTKSLLKEAINIHAINLFTDLY